jgi:nucleosome assembly protein 1-like 1
VIEKCQGTEIEWNEGCDVTVKKTKKKQKNKKTGQNRTVTKTVKQDSFFNFFKTISAEQAKEQEGNEEDEEEDIGNQMDEDFDQGQKIKDEVIPLALEFYMDVID